MKHLILIFVDDLEPDTDMLVVDTMIWFEDHLESPKSDRLQQSKKIPSNIN